jgi:hypothetical protein
MGYIHTLARNGFYVFATVTNPSVSESTTDSPYGQTKIKISESLKQIAQNGIHPYEVAKVIVEAVKTDNPDFRNVVGKDAAMMLETRRSMSDRAFQDLIRQQINPQ